MCTTVLILRVVYSKFAVLKRAAEMCGSRSVVQCVGGTGEHTKVGVFRISEF